MISSKERAERFRKARGNQSLKDVYEATKAKGNPVSASMISDLESYSIDRPVQYQKVAALAEYYGVNVAWLMGQSDSPSLIEDSQIVTRTTGLSDEAINMLKLMKNNKLTDSLNSLLETEDFARMVRWYKTARIINRYCTEADKTSMIDDEAYQGMIEDTLGKAIDSAWFPGESQIDMCLLRATNTLMHIFETIMKEEKNNG